MVDILKVQSQFLRPNIYLISLKALNIKLGKQLLFTAILFTSITKKVYLVKMCLKFDSSDSKSLQNKYLGLRYMKKIFRLIHQEIPQLSMHYSTVSKNHENEIVSQSSYEENSESDQNFSDGSEWNEKRNTQYVHSILNEIVKL